MKMGKDAYVIVGKIGSTYGIKGWIKVFTYTESLAGLIGFKPWYVEESQGWIKINRQEAKIHGQLVIAKFEGFDTPEHARALTGKKIAVHRAQLPALKKGEYYWRDLEGMSVIDQQGQILGKVTHLLATGSNDVLVVKGKTEHAIPYRLGDVIKNIDLEKKEILVDWEMI